MPILSHYTVDRNNNFNLIRFIAATMVIFSHSYPIVGIEAEPLSRFNLTFGSLAVDIFFITSGFLVTGSLTKRKSILDFSVSRLLRILPALIVAVLFCVFIIGLSYTQLPYNEYLVHTDTYQFIINNISLVIHPLQWHLPHVFEANPSFNTINGSLWTLPYELKMYGLLLLIGILSYTVKSKFRQNIIHLSVLILTIIAFIFIVKEDLRSSEIAIEFYKLFLLFFTGASFWILKDHIFIGKNIFIICLLLWSLIIFTGYINKLFFLHSLLTTYLIIFLAYYKNKNLLKFNHMGDYSYGLYIYAFPIQQALLASYLTLNTLPLFFLAFAITLLLAVLSWHFIEKPSLRLKHLRHYNFSDK